MTSADASAAEPPTFSPRTVLAMIAVGVLAAIGFAVLATFAPDLRSGADGGAHALSKSAVGYAGLAQLLRSQGVPVVISRGLPARTEQRGVLILTPGPDADAREIAEVARRHVHALVVLPKWLATPDPRRQGWVRRAGLAPAAAYGQLLPALGRYQLRRATRAERPSLAAVFGPFPLHATYPLGEVRSFQSATGDFDAWLKDEQGGAVLLNPRRGYAAVLTEPDLFNNHGLSSIETARAAMAIVDGLREGGPVVFDVTLNGFKRSRSIWKLALEPPFLGATLCGLAAALLMGVHAAVRFGPVRRPERAIAPGSAALADNAAGLIALARREPKMAPRYAALTRRAIARAVGAKRGQAAPATDAALDRLAGSGQTPFSALAAQAEQARDLDGLLQSARRLYDRRMEMTRERR